jgi:hypothetical protein
MRGSFLAVVVCFVASKAFAADVPMAATVPVEAQKAGEDKPICRTERSLGSRVVKRVCKTAAERQKEELDARTNIRLGGGRKGQPTDAFKRPGE